MEPHVTFDYTTVLNVVFLGLATVLVVRFMRTGGPDMALGNGYDRYIGKPIERSPLRRHRRGGRFGGASIDARLRVFPG
jgi:hypothetical protein